MTSATTLRCLAASTLTLAVAFTVGACSHPTTQAQVGDTVKAVRIPASLTLVAPTGWVGDLGAYVDATASKVTVLAVDPAGRTTTLGQDIDVSSRGATNSDLAAANRARGRQAVTAIKVPAGTGRGDLLTGTRIAFDLSTRPTRVVVLASGCTDVSGQQLDGVDLATPDAINRAAEAFRNAGLLDLGMQGDDLLTFSGWGSCTASGTEASARSALGDAICRGIKRPCIGLIADPGR